MRHRLLPFALALLAAACGADPPSVAAPGLPAFAARDPSVPIDNFARVADGLYRGAQPTAEGFRALKALGVRTVVNLRSRHSDADLARAVGLDVVDLPLHAVVDSDPPTPEEVRTFLDVVRDAARRPVYFHCAVGKDRTGTMCALYRMEVDGWEPEHAFAEMQAFGFHDVYRDLERFVLGYRPAAKAR